MHYFFSFLQAIFENGHFAAEKAVASLNGFASSMSSNKDKEACYRDPSFSGERESVCTRIVTRSPCRDVEVSWGLEGVYC